MKVMDDTLYNDSTYVHEDDSVEIYIDGDHNHGTTYDSYDRQFSRGGMIQPSLSNMARQRACCMAGRLFLAGIV